MEPHQYVMSANPDQSAGDRFPQWSHGETREFLIIRAELDQTFMETKRNRQLWEIISNKMMEKGFHRSADQCRCKWKNLVTRYKGSETMELENARQFPFHEELRAIFSARLQRQLWLEAEGGPSSSTARKGLRSSSEEDNSVGDSDAAAERGRKKKARPRASGGGGASVQEALQDFTRQLAEMDARWRREAEAREEERRRLEMEWRSTMESLERERLLMDTMWREREEQRRMREEARAEKRDALISALLNKYMREGI